MEENFEEFIFKEVYKGDVKALVSQFKENEARLNLKRRWLMGLPLTEAEENRVEEMLSAERNMPEALLREDDVSYEDIKTSIEMGFGACKREEELFCVQEEVQIFKSRDDYRDIFLLLDGMTNKGLCSFANILTGGVVKFEKTNWSMRRIIREHLRKFIRDKSGTCEIKLKHLLQLLKNPSNFHGSLLAVPTISEAYCDAANKVLDGLEDFCSITLRAMRAMKRKIKGVKGFIPTMKPRKFGITRDHLINDLRNECRKMLPDPRKGGEPPEKLASALGVAGLALTHLLKRPVAVNFRIFSCEVKALQIDVAKAIWLLGLPARVSVIELKLVQAMLDPNVELSVRSLRTGVRNMLTEYLFECGDMEEVPDSLIKTLDIINGKLLQFHKKRSSSGTHPSPQDRVKEEMQREIEHILAVSAQAKEVLLDGLPGHEFDEDFAEAYVEDFEECDTPFTSDDEQIGDVLKHYDTEFHDSQSQTSSIGETCPDKLNSDVSTGEADSSHFRSPDGSLNAPLESTYIKEMDLDVTSGADHSHPFMESEIQYGQCTDTEQTSLRRAVKRELDCPGPFEATCTKSLSYLPPLLELPTRVTVKRKNPQFTLAILKILTFFLNKEMWTVTRAHPVIHTLRSRKLVIPQVWWHIGSLAAYWMSLQRSKA